ncbi:hypothetical protein [Streptomonospora halophila]
MPRTDRSRRGARVAAGVRTARGTSGMWPSARRWLVVAGLLSGAWFAGAACAAADESPVGGLTGSAASGQASQQGGPAAEAVQDLDPAASGGSSADGGSGRAAPGDSGGSAGGSGEGAAADGTGAQVVADGVDTPVSASVGSDADAGGASGSEASSDSDARADRRGPTSGSADSAQGGSATGRLTGAVTAVSEVGRDAGRTVPVSVAASGGSGPAAAVSAAAASEAAASSHGLPGFGVADLRPAGFGKAGVIPGLGLGKSAGPGAGSAADRAPDNFGPRPADRGTASAPADQGSVRAHPGSAAVADYADVAVHGGSAASDDDGSAQDDGGVDRPEPAAAVGSGANTFQPGGGMCAGYLPAADSAVPAAGALQRARQALADVPRDLGEQPTFSPD